MKAPQSAITPKKQTLQSKRLTRDKFLSDDEYDLLVAHLKRHHDKHKRDTALILTALFTGARAREVLNIRRKDLNKEHKSISIYGVKNSYDREISIAPWLFDCLINLPASPENDRIFNISYQRLDRIWRTWRTCNKKFHSLRHTFAMRLYKKKLDFKAVQTALGHVYQTNTMIYLDFLYSTEHLRKIMSDAGFE